MSSPLSNSKGKPLLLAKVGYKGKDITQTGSEYLVEINFEMYTSGYIKGLFNFLDDIDHSVVDTHQFNGSFDRSTIEQGGEIRFTYEIEEDEETFYTYDYTGSFTGSFFN
jgi:hypothetical protein